VSTKVAEAPDFGGHFSFILDDMNRDRLSIFVSSTYLDLKAYREVVRNAVFTLREHANDMLFWPADERSAEELSLDELEEAQLLVLIVAHRYGTVPVGASKSVTEAEFDYAVEHNIPVLAFFVDEQYQWPPNMIDFAQYEQLLAFKSKIREYCTPAYFTTPESLATQVTQALVNFDRRKRAVAPLTPSLRVYLAKALRKKADPTVFMGVAEDGLPLALAVKRSDNLVRSMERISTADLSPRKLYQAECDYLT